VVKFFGKMYLTPVEGTKDLWQLFNPIGPNLFGVQLDDGHQVVPCDNFITDLSSDPFFLWAIYPPTYGRKGAVHHDWGYEAHKQTVEELLSQMECWFDSVGWAMGDRVEYVNWLRARTREEWDHDYYILTEYDSLGPWRRWTAWKLLRLFGGWAWDAPKAVFTQRFRETGKIFCDAGFLKII
jgi:hypothetical protein